MNCHNRIGALLLILAVSVAACAPLLPAVPALPTQPPGAMGTYVAGTRAAAQTQTAYYITPSSTPTLTRTPTRTPTVTPTATATIIFKYNSPVPGGKATATKTGGGGKHPTSTPKGGGGGGGTDLKWACEVLSTTIRVNGVIVPGNTPHVPANTVFTVTWRLRNTGFKAWDHDSVDYLYKSGTKFQDSTPSRYNFPDVPSSVPRLKEVDIVVDNPLDVPPAPAPMIAPSAPGVYNSHWVLQASQNKICDMYITIEVP